MWAFMLIYLVPLSVIIGYIMGGMWTFLTPVTVFGIIPFVDLLAGKNTTNVPENREKDLSEQRGYRMITWVCAPLQVATVFWGSWIIVTQHPSLLESIGLTISVGVCSGILGINVSHELAHRVNNRLEPFLSRLMLWTVLYMHWGLEHVVGHHRHVATPDDPATARYGDSFYEFWPRTVFGSFNSVWEFEVNRLSKDNLPAWSMQNRVVVFLILQLLLLIAVSLIAGWIGLVYIVTQAMVAISLLEIVNYIEHYGLERRLENNRYEKVQPWHSWNASNWLTNKFLFNLQRHSDHHYKPGRRYQILRHFDESPQLPTGYAGMILLAACPPIWRRVMDPKVEAIRKKEASN